jgi:hypothetical protein
MSMQVLGSVLQACSPKRNPNKVRACFGTSAWCARWICNAVHLVSIKWICNVINLLLIFHMYLVKAVWTPKRRSPISMWGCGLCSNGHQRHTTRITTQLAFWQISDVIPIMFGTSWKLMNCGILTSAKAEYIISDRQLHSSRKNNCFVKLHDTKVHVIFCMPVKNMQR